MAEDVINITVDGKPTRAREGETLLDVCRRLGRDIPTLCHHEALEAYAACRVCLVELVNDGDSSLVPACQYPAEEGLRVLTDSPAVVEGRRFVLELLLARCPRSEVIRDLAARYGVVDTPYSSDDQDETCILCGLCVRACEDKLQIAAVGFADRGIDRRVGSAFDEASDDCIGCGACIAVCPTGHIRCVDDGPIRRMETLKTELKLAACRTCGRSFVPIRQIEHIRTALPEHVPLEEFCPACRRARVVGRLSEISMPLAAAHQPSSKNNRKSG